MFDGEGKGSGRTAGKSSARRRALVGGFVAVLVVGAVAVVPLLVDDSSGSQHTAKPHDAKQSVLAALGTTVSAGSYDMTFTDQWTPGSGPRQSCGGSACVSLQTEVAVTGHGTVNSDPYAMVAISQITGYGEVTTYVNGTTVWELGAGNYGASGGSPLPGFAPLVEGTLGAGGGALAMISLASHNGYLNLEESTVQGAQPAGTGSVEGDDVTYYDVTIDITKLAGATNLTDEERATIEAAVPLLKGAGYAGTDERIGVDAAGFIREVTATERFADGSSDTRHTILSNFGCAAKVYTPDETPPAVTTTLPCASLAAPTPTTSASSTAASSTSSPTVAPTTTSAPSSSTSLSTSLPLSSSTEPTTTT
jgi:hypothetical protein